MNVIPAKRVGLAMEKGLPPLSMIQASVMSKRMMKEKQNVKSMVTPCTVALYHTFSLSAVNVYKAREDGM